MYFTHSPPLSLCWYDRLLYELWIHDLCLNPSTSPDIFYAETSRHSPPLVTRPRDNHLTTWRGVTSRVTAVTQPAVMRCLDRVTMLHHQTMSHSRTLQRFILETLKTILTQHSWWTVWLCSYCCSGLVVTAGTKKPCISPLLRRVVCSLCWLSSPHYGCRGSRRNIRIQIGTHPPPPHSHYILQSDFNGG